jgi:four helix bundle protein
MLSIYAVSLQVCRDVRRLSGRIRERNLVDQMTRAAMSVPLNLAESDGVTGGNRKQRRLMALGSAREVVACLDVADAMCGVVVDEDVRKRLDHVIGVLVKVTR